MVPHFQLRMVKFWLDIWRKFVLLAEHCHLYPSAFTHFVSGHTIRFYSVSVSGTLVRSTFFVFPHESFSHALCGSLLGEKICHHNSVFSLHDIRSSNVNSLNADQDKIDFTSAQHSLYSLHTSNGLNDLLWFIVTWLAADWDWIDYSEIKALDHLFKLSQGLSKSSFFQHTRVVFESLFEFALLSQLVTLGSRPSAWSHGRMLVWSKPNIIKTMAIYSFAP